MSALRAIKAGQRALGLDDDSYRAVLARVTGKRSAKDMDAGEQRKVLDEFRRLGFGTRNGGTAPLSGPYARKLQALWLSAYNLGLVRDKRDSALVSFVERQTGIAHLAWLREARHATRAIEALKGWMTRDAGVTWPHQQDGNAAKLAVIEAQERILTGRCPARLRSLDQTIAFYGAAIRGRR